MVATDCSDPLLTKWMHRDYEEEWKKSTESSRALSLGTLSKEEVDLHESTENKIRGGKRTEAAYRRAANKGRAAQKPAENAEKRAEKERRAAEKELSKKALCEGKKGEDTSHMTPQSKITRG